MPSRCTAARRLRAEEILATLSTHHAPLLADKQRRRRDGIDTLVLAFLSQNTNMSNARAGYKQLRRAFPTWSKLLDAPIRDIQRPIAVCGLARMRAHRLHSLLSFIKKRHGKLSLDFLSAYTPDDAYAYLTSYHGIGPKTAAYTLCFAFDMPVLPVDHGIWRMSRRLRLVRPKANEKETTLTLQKLLPAGAHFPMHVTMFAHAKQYCRPRNPKCRDCPLVDQCAHGRARLRHRKDESSKLDVPPKHIRSLILSRFASAGIPKHPTEAAEAERLAAQSLLTRRRPARPQR
jgi:endonuclease-3